MQKNKSKNTTSDKDQLVILKYLGEKLEEEGFTPAQFFKGADKNFSKVLKIDDLKEYVKQVLPK